MNFVSEPFYFAACKVYITIIILHITNITLLICSIIHCVEWRSCFWVFFNLLVLCRRQSMALMKFSSIFENTGKNCNVIVKWHFFFYGKHVRTCNEFQRVSVCMCQCLLSRSLNSEARFLQCQQWNILKKKKRLFFRRGNIITPVFWKYSSQKPTHSNYRSLEKGLKVKLPISAAPVSHRRMIQAY